MKRDFIKSHDEAYMAKKKEQRKKTAIRFLITLIIFVIICLSFRSCRARDEPEPDRIYEEDCIKKPAEKTPVSAENAGKRLNLAVTGEYHISDQEPLFYIGYPKDNVYDVVFTLNDMDGNKLYRTNYVAPGTTVAIDGTAFLEKGEQKINCVVGIYTKDSGKLLSNCTTVVLNISYE